MTESIILKGALGLNNIIDPLRHQYDPETGVGFLAEAVNVDIDDTGYISRRPGQTLLSAGSFHSVFCDDGDCFVVQDRTADAAIFKVNTDYSLTGVRSGLTKGARVSFCQIGSETYYTNGYQMGRIINGASFPWPTAEHVGVESLREFATPPPGTHLCWFQGRLWVADGAYIWVSEVYAPGKFRLAGSGFQFGSPIRMMKPVKNGVWVSDSQHTGFIQAGNSIAEMSWSVKSPYPAHEYSACIDLVDLSHNEIPGLSALWSSNDGLTVGTDDGRLIVLTKKKLFYPQGNFGATVADEDQIINSVY